MVLKRSPVKPVVVVVVVVRHQEEMKALFKLNFELMLWESPEPVKGDSPLTRFTLPPVRGIKEWEELSAENRGLLSIVLFFY